MDPMDYQNIRSWCREAQAYADELGVEEALTYLIGERFSPLVKSLMQARTHVKYLYTERDRSVVKTLAEKDKAYQVGYLMAVENNYKEQLEDIKHLEQLIGDFILEIREAFEEQDVMEYLETYPRLSAKPEDYLTQDTLGVPGPETLNSNELMAEVEDIYLADEIRKLFENKRLAR